MFTKTDAAERYYAHEIEHKYIPVKTRPGYVYTGCQVYFPAPLAGGEWVSAEGTITATNDDLRDRGLTTGWTTALWAADEFNNWRQVGARGGRNITPLMHHDERIRLSSFEAQPGDSRVALVSWAYNKHARSGEKLRIDDCELSVTVE